MIQRGFLICQEKLETHCFYSNCPELDDETNNKTGAP